MKQRICCLFLLLFCACSSVCFSEGLIGEYTDVPSAMTQDSVVEVNCDEACEVTLLAPYAEAMRLLSDVYDFVWHEFNRPARYYDIETQEKLQALFPETNIDSFLMTEFMAQELKGNPEKDVTIERLLDVEYQPDQLTAVVLGYQMENGEYRWFPYRADVKELGLITYKVPAEDFNELKEKKVIYNVLTVRVGPRGGILLNEEVYTEQVVTPSKGVHDIVTVRKWYTYVPGEEIDDTFSIYLVDKTEPMQEEVEKIGAHVSEENTAISYFPENLQAEASLMLEENANADDLLIYDIVALRARDYKDTYGDVVTENLFASAYSSECSMVAFLGFPVTDENGETTFTWYCLRAESIDDAVEIAFKQLVLPEMEKEAAMLVVLSEPIQ